MIELKELYGQSYEQYFLNDDGSLDYERMIAFVDKAIREGKTKFFKGMDKKARKVYKQNREEG